MGVRSFQTMVPMRDGTRLNTFVFLPESGGRRFPVILHRTPYGIAAADARDKFDHTNAWLPSAAEQASLSGKPPSFATVSVPCFIEPSRRCRRQHQQN